MVPYKKYQYGILTNSHKAKLFWLAKNKKSFINYCGEPLIERKGEEREIIE